MIVIDANVAVAAFSANRHTETARRILGSATPITAPDIFPGEVANALSRLVRTRRVGPSFARSALREVMNRIDVILPTSALTGPAFEAALRLNHGVFDCLYLQAARTIGARLITFDEGFAAKVQATEDASFLMSSRDWI